MELDLFKSDTETFIKEISGPDNQKVAEAAGLFIAQKLRERAFSRQIITPRQVTRYDLQVSEFHDQLVFVDEKEVNVAPAKAVNFKAEPDGRYITTPRYTIPIFEIGSEIYSKKEIEFLATVQPLTKLIEENTVREIEEVEDSYFLQYTDAAAAAAGNLVSYSTGAGGALTKGAIKAGMNLIDSKRLLAKTVLMSKVTFNDFLTMTFQDLGSDLLKEISVEGYKYYQFGGLKIIVSIKDELFRHPSLTLASGDAARMVYFFAEEKALGRFLVLDQAKFGVRRVFNLVEFCAWEYIGMSIANNSAVARVTLID
ncbi:MAG TPA: hypothetical protein VLH09_05115 [Bryobacteraceae bacterium]|nr:hypothetical protein [Bryobacteraceae bacterium]